MSDPPYANAVAIAYPGGVRWRVDAAAIAAFGDRVEGALDVGDVDDLAAIDRIGDQWLAAHSGPRTSTVVGVEPTGAGDQPGDAFDVRQTVNAAGDDLECVGLSFGWGGGREDRMEAAPEFSTRLDARRADTTRALDRMIARAGGATAASATSLDLGTKIPTGKVAEVQIPPWSWGTKDSLTALGLLSGWQRFPIETPCRLYKWTVTCDNSGATGSSQFRINIARVAGGAVEWNGLLDIVLTSAETTKTVPIWAYFRGYQGDLIFPSVVAAGGHSNGSIKVVASEIV